MEATREGRSKEAETLLERPWDSSISRLTGGRNMEARPKYRDHNKEVERQEGRDMEATREV
jgi:hypothetical protein